VFAYLPDPRLAIAVGVLHGICYAFFFATVYIFVDEYAPKDIRSSAQGLFNVLILGLGPIASNFIAPLLGAKMQLYSGDPDYQAIFTVPMVAALVAVGVLAVAFFPPPKSCETA
jgi:MFS family permease